MKYLVNRGVKGAGFSYENIFDTRQEAEKVAAEWIASRSDGDYWATVRTYEVRT